MRAEFYYEGCFHSLIKKLLWQSFLLPKFWHLGRKCSFSNHTFMMSTRKGVGILKLFTCLQVLLLLNNTAIVHFLWIGLGRWGWVTELVIFCRHQKCMTSKTRNEKNKKEVTSNYQIRTYRSYKTSFLFPAFGGWHSHFGTFTCIKNFHPLLPALCLNHLQSPAFCKIS